NLLNRTLGLLKKNCESTLVMDSTMAAEGTPLKDTVEKLDLVIILEVMRIIAVALSPIAPCLSLRIYSVDQFNSITWNDTKWGGPKGGQVMAQASPVFARIELNAENDVEEKVKDSKKKGKAKVKVEQPQAVAEA
ncbi:unnamed protein product, partial [Brassica napus]